jgi:hypothetical protein
MLCRAVVDMLPAVLSSQDFFLKRHFRQRYSGVPLLDAAGPLVPAAPIRTALKGVGATSRQKAVPTLIT